MAEEDTQHQLTFGEHLDELRARMIISLIALFVAFLVCFAYSEPLMSFVLEPMVDALDELGYTPTVVFTKAQEKFIAYLKLSAVAALFVGSPVCLWQAWAFVSAGLYPHERRYVLTFAPSSLLSFVTGVLFFYFLMMPWGLQFLLAFGGDPSIQPMIQVSEHISFFLMLSLIMGMVFELPLVMLFLTKVHIVTWQQFAEKRRFAILFGFILAAILTPPDVFTQVMLALPFCFLYEIGILVSRVGMVTAGEGEDEARVNLSGLFLLLLPTLLIGGLVSAKLIYYPSSKHKGAGRHLDDRTYSRVLGQMGQGSEEAWLDLLGSEDGLTRLDGLRRLGASKGSSQKLARLRDHMQHDADPALQVYAAVLLFRAGSQKEAAGRLLTLLESASKPRYAYLANRALEQVSGKAHRLSPQPDAKQVTAAADAWRDWVAQLRN